MSSGLLRGRLGRGVLSQGISSVANTALSVVAASQLSGQQFGAFATTYIVYVLGLGLVRATVCEPALVCDVPAARGGEILGSSLLLGAGASVVTAVAAFGASVSGSDLAAALLALAAVLPLLFVIEAGRWLAFAERQPERAITIDALWAVAQAVALVGLVTAGSPSPETFVLAWGLAAGVGVVPILRRYGLPRPSSRWIVRNRELSWRYAAEWFVGAGTAALGLILLGPIAGLAAVGAVRGAQILFGPINVLFGGVLTVTVPEGAAMTGPGLRRMAAWSSLALALSAAALAALVLLVPDSLGVRLLGDTWDSARPLFVPIGLTTVAGGVLAGAFAGLRSLRAARSSLGVRVKVFPLLLGLPLLGGWWFASRGYAWGSFVAVSISAGIWWRVFIAASTRTTPVAVIAAD